MTNGNETVQERLERMKKEAEAAKASAVSDKAELVEELTHTSDGAPNFEEIARKLEAMKEGQEAGKNEGYVKMTIYVRQDIHAAFQALSQRRGQQKENYNQALADFVTKKSREMNL